MKNIFRTAPLAYALLFLSAFVLCPPHVMAASEDAPDRIALEASSESLTWQLLSPAKAGTSLVEIVLKDKEGNLVADKNMTGELWMPEMPMKGYPVSLLFTDAERVGVYGCLAQYMHGGLWRITAKVELGCGRTEQVQFDLTLAD